MGHMNPIHTDPCQHYGLCMSYFQESPPLTPQKILYVIRKQNSTGETRQTETKINLPCCVMEKC